MQSVADFYKQRLQRELQARCDKNPRYSVRAFARALQIDAGALSRILSDKQVPSFKLASKIVAALTMDPLEKENFFASVAARHKQRNLQRLSPHFFPLASTPVENPEDLSLELFKAMSDWYHVAIVELTVQPGFDSSPGWIASELGISPTEAKLALDRLEQLGVLENKNGRMQKRNVNFTTADKHLTSSALKKLQRQLLEKAMHSIENDPIEERSVTSMTMSINEKRLPEARKLIDEFNMKMAKFLETGKRNRVYNLEVAFFPLQKKKS